MQTRPYAPHALIGDRFLLEGVAGSGGMGTVYRARDTSTGSTVAIKILHPQLAQGPSATEVARFRREVQVLSSLSHPGIVSYIAHGETSDGLPYFAMEWLSGEDLAARLDRGPLLVSEALTLLTNVADALSVAHGHGIVHRDLKPSNLFLRAKLLERVAVLDFGVAQWGNGAISTTRTGMLVGTPEYMAPEQARGQRVIPPAADIFTLGTVIYHCLAGQNLFHGEHVVAALTSVLFDEAPSLRSLRPEIPKALDELVCQMLSKRAEDRPQDAGVLLARLGELRREGHPDARPELGKGEQSGAFYKALPLDNEQTLVTVLVVQQAPDPQRPVASLPEAQPGQGVELASILSGDTRNKLRSLGVDMEHLADGTLVGMLSAVGSPRDQVAQASRCALLLANELPTARIAVATGPGQLRRGRNIPVGQAVERALQLVRQQDTDSPQGTDDTGSAPDRSRILLDSVSAEFLPGQFQLQSRTHYAFLLGEREEQAVDDLRLVLGRPTQCVGREQELSLLESMLGAAFDEPMSRAVLLIAPPGLGKSRIRHEFLRRLKAQRPEVETLLGRCDPILTASPHGLIAQLLRSLCDSCRLPDSEQQHKQLQERLARHLPEQQRESTLATLSVLCGVSGSTRKLAAMSALQRDTQKWIHQLTQSFCDFLSAECAHHPVVIVLEDLHWSDGPSLRLIESAMRNLPEVPLFVLGLARPEIEQIFPNLWAGRVQELRLTGLGKKASERLARQVLGQTLGDKTIARIVEQAAGNALFLEELVRAAAEGKGEEPPATVLAMLQARILRMDTGARRLLRAASIFGLTFWRGGLLWLFGLRQAQPERVALIDSGLKYLVDAEVIERHRESRFANDQQYGFRHALMRDAAYALLTEDDTKLGHGIAGLFLEQAGERDQALLAGHTHRIVQYIQQRHSSLMVSRLMMLTGLRLHMFTAATPDDPAVLHRIRAALSHLLRGEELVELQSLFHDR